MSAGIEQLIGFVGVCLREFAGYPKPGVAECV